MWWIEFDHCYVHVRLMLPWCSKVGYKCSYIFHVDWKVGDEKRFELNIYIWGERFVPFLAMFTTVSVCDGVCTWSQNFVELLRSALTLLLFSQPCWFTLGNIGKKRVVLEGLTSDINLCNCDFMHLPWCCKAVLSRQLHEQQIYGDVKTSIV
jgi:hypothetical protein